VSKGGFMIRHIVAWNINADVSEFEKTHVLEKLKHELEDLGDKISELKDIHVTIDLLDSSNREIMLSTTFQNEEDLISYQNHPEHLKVAAYIKQVTCDRVCLDYESESLL
jgi:hypothetical protein